MWWKFRDENDFSNTLFYGNLIFFDAYFRDLIYLSSLLQVVAFSSFDLVAFDSVFYIGQISFSRLITVLWRILCWILSWESCSLLYAWWSRDNQIQFLQCSTACDVCNRNVCDNWRTPSLYDAWSWPLWKWLMFDCAFDNLSDVECPSC